MNVIEPVVTRNLVRADSWKAENGFRYLDEDDNTYSYSVPMNSNSTHLYIRRAIRENQSVFITPEYVLVFNVQSNVAGIVKADKMVEPVEFKVTVITKEK
ncbi:hypothetical protein LCGC14_2442630 [marine sediment metagenome]|uniref:Uncharacterized protein n=1 Tax=marine sediment metagenome TaxID=412755 RepID=A0A0F9DVK4_9ZZZZ